jgi:hypothetical protein
MEEQTVLLPEATIAGVLQSCSLVDGWCTSSPTLHLSAVEPVAGESISLIEGTRNGEPFACSGVVCDVPLLEGSNTFTFWALSTWGDSSQMGTFSALVDSLGPTLSIPDSWYVWEPLAIGLDDGGIGIDRVKLTIEGGNFGDRSFEWSLTNLPNDFIWDRHIGEVIAPIGDYPVSVKAWDLLGNSTSATGLILIPAPEEPETSEGVPESLSEPGSGEAPEPTAPPSVGELSIEPTSTDEPVVATLIDGPGASIVPAESATTTTSTEGGSGTLLWGAAALAAAASATAYALNRRQARETQIEKLREEAAEAASPEAFARRLSSLRARAEAVVAPIRNFMIVAAAAATKAAQELAQRRQKALFRLLSNRTGTYIDPQISEQALETQFAEGPGAVSQGSSQLPTDLIAGRDYRFAERLDGDSFVEWLTTALRAPGEFRSLLPWLASNSRALNRFIRETALQYTFSPFPADPIGVQFQALANLLDQPPTQSTGLLARAEDFIHTTAHHYVVNDLNGISRVADDPLARLFVHLSDELKKPHSAELKGAILAVTLQLTGELISRHNSNLGSGLKDLGETVGASTDLAGFPQAWRAIQSRGQLASGELTFLSLSSTLGRVIGVLGGIGGALQYVTSVKALASDPSVDPRIGGSGVWNERIGLMLEGIGGVAMAGGGVTALIPGGQPVAVILLPLGAATWGVGTLVRKWDEYVVGLRAWGDARTMWNEIVAPYYVSRVWDWYDRTVNKPIYESLETWKGIASNGVEIARRSPDYIYEHLIQPGTEAFTQRVLDPVKDTIEEVISDVRAFFGWGP